LLGAEPASGEIGPSTAGPEAGARGRGVAVVAESPLASLAGAGIADRVLALQRTAGNRAVQRLLQRREVANDSAVSGTQDWTTTDRESNSTRWQQACLQNLNTVDSSQYRRIVERRDFYWWFYNYTAAKGYTTRWPLAAAIVANGAHLVADMDQKHRWSNETLSMANVQLQGMMREGNQVIFDNVLPKLKRLLDGGPITGRAALQWDMQVLAEEQNLVQPMYARMTKETRDQIAYIARQNFWAAAGSWWTNEGKVDKGPFNNPGDVPAFAEPDLQSPADRWRYGMKLGDLFTPGGSGFNPATDTMPSVASGYQDGSEFAKVDTRAALHELDAWLNPNRVSRVGSGSDLNAIIGALTAPEKEQVLADSSPDGWAYSTAFAQFSFITEAQVRAALPSDAGHAAAVDAFVARFKAEQQRVQISVPIMVGP
jgi:hypothetical protein